MEQWREKESLPGCIEINSISHNLWVTEGVKRIYTIGITLVLALGESAPDIPGFLTMVRIFGRDLPIEDGNLGGSLLDTWVVIRGVCYSRNAELKSLVRKEGQT